MYIYIYRGSDDSIFFVNMHVVMRLLWEGK